MPVEIPQLVPVVQQIEAHIIAHHGVTSRELGRIFDLAPNAISSHTGRLRASGKIRRFRIPGERSTRWAAGPDHDFLPNSPNEGQPKQTTVTTWEPVKVVPQSWLSSLL